MRRINLTKKQEDKIVSMYSIDKLTITEIINNCGFDITKPTIYRTLKDKSIKLDRKKGNKHDLIGKTFGYLTVLKMSQTNKSGKSYEWRAICNCKCGSVNNDISPQALLRGATTSCGCRRDQYIKNTGKNHKHFTGYEGISGKYWGIIKGRANKRNYDFNLDIKYCWELYITQEGKCNLSGLPIGFAIANKKTSETTASLDRIDSSKGYVVGNVQWVHKNINIMKNVYNQDYFISLCDLVSKNNKLK